LEYICNYTVKINKSDEDDSKRADIIESEIQKWIELLVNNINMFANDAVQYFKALQFQKGLDKKYNRNVFASVSKYFAI